MFIIQASLVKALLEIRIGKSRILLKQLLRLGVHMSAPRIYEYFIFRGNNIWGHWSPLPASSAQCTLVSDNTVHHKIVSCKKLLARRRLRISSWIRTRDWRVKIPISNHWTLPPQVSWRYRDQLKRNVLPAKKKKSVKKLTFREFLCKSNTTNWLKVYHHIST